VVTKVKNFEGSRTGTAGRPRDDTKDEAITSAMIAMLAAHGYDGASFEKVATAAGVSRPAIYRRWKAKELLVIDAVRAMLNEDLASYTDDTSARGKASRRS
jgi:AcrR family transcriptional regulator